MFRMLLCLSFLTGSGYYIWDIGLAIGNSKINLNKIGNKKDNLKYSVVSPFRSFDIVRKNEFDKLPVGGGVSFVAARGEYEPATIIVFSQIDKDKEYTIKIRGFLSGGVTGIKNSNFDIDYLVPWYQVSGAGLNHRKDGDEGVFIPELLVKNPNLIINDHKRKRSSIKTILKDGKVNYIVLGDEKSKKDNKWKEQKILDSEYLEPFRFTEKYRQIWLTLYVPESVSEGIYVGDLVVSSDDEEIVIPIKVKVLPFTLEKPSLTYSLYYRGRLDPTSNEITSEYKTERQLELELKNIKNHGVCCPTLYQRLIPKYPRDRVISPDKLIEKHLKIRKDIGLDIESLYYLGILSTSAQDDSVLKSVSDSIKEFRGIVSPLGVIDTYIYGVEEVTGKKLISQKKAWDNVKSTGAKIFTAGYGDHVNVMRGRTDLLIYSGKPNSELANKVHEYSNKIFSYANPQTGPENPMLFRKNYGFSLISSNFDGAMIYAYQHGFGDIWNDFDHKIYRDHVLAYPTSDSVIDTIAWEGLREGIDDVRYYTTLKKHMQNANIKNDNNLNKIENLISNNKDSNPDIIRDEIVKQLEALFRNK